MNESTNALLANPDVLWSVAALGATLAEWQRKRAEEEAARLAALRNSDLGGVVLLHINGIAIDPAASFA